MMQRHQLEVDRLYRRPEHPIRPQRSPVCAIQLSFGARPLQCRHGGKENEEIGRGKDHLIGHDLRRDGEVVVLQDDSLLQESVP